MTTLVDEHNIYMTLHGIHPLMKKVDPSKEYPGEWLLLLNDEIIDHSANIEDILKLAEEKFPEERFPEDTVKITKVLSGDNRLY